MSRTVMGSLMRGSTDAGVYALAARGGYLFSFGQVRAGPIAGLSYLGGTVDGYTETGALATTVGEQTVESITGSAGVRLLAPFQAGGNLFVPYLNVTWEHQFGDSTQSLAVSFAGVSTPVSVPAFDTRDFGRIEGGITVELAPEASINLSGASTFARDAANDFRVSAGVNYRF
jgi:outer membrane autotransporter protein